MLKVLITGGSGFIGSHLIEAMLAEDYSVRTFDTSDYPYPIPPLADFEAFVGDLTVLPQVEAAVADCDGIIHLGAVSRVGLGYQQPLDCIATNIVGTANLLEVARRALKPPWMVLASSAGAVELPGPDQDFAHLYGITKFCAEQCARRYSEDYGLRVLTLRISDVYGSDRDNAAKVLPLFIERARRSEPIAVHNPGMRFDFTYYEDVIAAIIRGTAYLEAQSGGMYDSVQICTGQEVTLLELSETIVEAMGSSSVIEIPVQRRPDPGHGVKFDPSHAHEILGFQAQVSLREGIRHLASGIPA